MHKARMQDILSLFASNYTSRELDRIWYDRFMETSVGQNLSELTKVQKHALEFISYAVSAYVLTGQPTNSPVRQFIHRVIADAPSEIAARMYKLPSGVDASDLNGALDFLSDNDLEKLKSMSKKTDSAVQDKMGDSTKAGPSEMSLFADKINEARKRLRAKGT